MFGLWSSSDLWIACNYIAIDCILWSGILIVIKRLKMSSRCLSNLAEYVLDQVLCNGCTSCFISTLSVVYNCVYKSLRSQLSVFRRVCECVSRSPWTFVDGKYNTNNEGIRDVVSRLKISRTLADMKHALKCRCRSKALATFKEAAVTSHLPDLMKGNRQWPQLNSSPRNHQHVYV
jgi:hypothetical protein